MAHFNNALDFAGSYTGSYDGRNAQVTITVAGDGDPFWILTVTFTDLERNETFSGSVVQNDRDAHVVNAFDLTLVGGSDVIHWSELLLHTWNTSYMSGTSVWNNTAYGLSFTRK